jgi:hypothetical protein
LYRAEVYHGEFVGHRERIYVKAGESTRVYVRLGLESNAET